MPVPLDFNGAAAPVNRAFECEWIAELDVKPSGFLLRPSLLHDKIQKAVVGRFIAEDVDVAAQKSRIDEKLKWSRAEDPNLQARFRWQPPRQLVKPLAGGRRPRDTVCLKMHKAPDRSAAP
jgi:hypothetical protein